MAKQFDAYNNYSTRIDSTQLGSHWNTKVVRECTFVIVRLWTSKLSFGHHSGPHFSNPRILVIQVYLFAAALVEGLAPPLRSSVAVLHPFWKIQINEFFPAFYLHKIISSLSFNY